MQPCMVASLMLIIMHMAYDHMAHRVHFFMDVHMLSAVFALQASSCRLCGVHFTGYEENFKEHSRVISHVP